MRLVLDAQLPPHIASWVENRFETECVTLDRLKLRGRSDFEIFEALRTDGSVIVTKDADFVAFVRTHNPPPQGLWICCGNVTNRALIDRFESEMGRALGRLKVGDPVVQIVD